jgi:tetratricopeptide (TPR) repeat protein
MAADDAKPETALTRPMIATDLDKAGKGQLVYVGRDGEVKHPTAVRNRQIAAYLTFGGITAAGVALAATSFPVLVPFYLALGGRFFGTVRAVRRVNEASVALSKGDAATGRALAEPVTRAWWAPTRVRALAELRVAIADALDGNGEQALDRVRRARAKLSPRLIQHQFSYYTEINLLTALGRTKEARNLLESRGPVPTGEVLKLSHWIAQMHLWVAENAPKPLAPGELPPREALVVKNKELEIDETELHDRMRKGLSMTAGADLLLLCAWCYAYRGEHDDARFAYRQAKDREGSHRLDVAMPKLAAWIDDYRKEHPEVETPDADEP